MKSQIKMLIIWDSKCSLIFFMRATYWPYDLRLGLPPNIANRAVILVAWVSPWTLAPASALLCLEGNEETIFCGRHPPSLVVEPCSSSSVMMICQVDDGDNDFLMWSSVIMIMFTVPLIDVCSSSQTSSNTRDLPCCLTLTTVFVFSRY